MAKYIHMRHELDKKTVARWNQQRWLSDDVEGMPDGFTLRKRGREGSLYYRYGDNVIELGWELSGSEDFDLEINPAGLSRWITGEPVPPAQQTRIRLAAEHWLVVNHTRARFLDDRSDFVSVGNAKLEP
jgi:hypothetical protein